MRKIERLKIKIRPSESRGIFHDSRTDVRQLAAAINMIVDKQNELIDAINELRANG